MKSVEQFHEDLRILLKCDSINEALYKYEKLPNESKDLLGLLAFKMEDGKVPLIEEEELRNFMDLAKRKNDEGFMDEPLSDEMAEKMHKMLFEDMFKQSLKNKNKKD